MERTRAPLGERRLVFFSTALVLLFFLAGFVYLALVHGGSTATASLTIKRSRCS